MKRNLLIIVVLFSIALLYRLPNLGNPFWVDEFSTARNAVLIQREGLNAFTQKNEFLEHHNVTTHVLTAVFFTFFGTNETVARLPMVIIGATIPVTVFFLTKRIFTTSAATCAAILTTFSYFEITWSRQARSYALQQLLLLLIIWFYLQLKKQFSITTLVGFLLVAMLGVLTHTTFLLLLGAILLHYCFEIFQYKNNLLKNQKLLIVGAIILGVVSMVFTYLQYPQAIISGLRQAFIEHPNNLWYYHSFLWREQTLLTFLAVIGVLIGLVKRKSETSLLLIVIAAYLGFISFLFSPYVSRYILPIFPLFLIFAGVTLSRIPQLITSRFTLPISIVLTGFIIFNGDTFVLKPKAYYSVNHDMREVALIDYNQVYSPIKKVVQSSARPIAIIDTWPDRARWYVGYDNPNIYYFHWENETGTVNGLSKKTDYTLQDGEKTLPGFQKPKIRFIGTVDDLQLVATKYSQGFIWIDDASLPTEVTEFAKEHFKQELYLDHYPLDDNPYSIWPGTLYSWGMP